jgi:chromatin remodeling complex protein RSC6
MSPPPKKNTRNNTGEGKKRREKKNIRMVKMKNSPRKRAVNISLALDAVIYFFGKEGRREDYGDQT